MMFPLTMQLFYDGEEAIVCRVLRTVVLSDGVWECLVYNKKEKELEYHCVFAV
jgi:hypothetical protein